MATNIRRGRDPEQHQVHDVAGAANYLGLLGQISIVRNGGVMTGIQLHDGTTRGGNITIGNGGSPTAQALPSAPLVAPLARTLVSATPLTVTHNLGYRPLVQVLRVDTHAVLTDVEIIHSTLNAFTVERATGLAVSIIVR